MTTILRVKRRCSDEPLDALILACKKRKTDNDETIEAAGSKEPLTTVVKFAGTVQNQEVNAVKEIAKTLTSDQLKTNYKQHSVDIQNKVRSQKQEDSRENRYKVVNCFREIESSVTDEKTKDLGMTVIDVEDSVSCDKKSEETDDEHEGPSPYVFDLYCTMADSMENIFTEYSNGFTVEPFHIPSFYSGYRESCDCSDCEHREESEDSNSESNWKNDYPDSDVGSDNSVTHDYLSSAVGNMWLDDAQELSTDDEDDNLIYTVDESDVENFGYSYAKFKASLKSQEEDDEDEDEDEEDGEDNDVDSNYSGVYISEIHTDDEAAED